MAMTKQYINAAALLFSSWAVYSYCQDDSLLPITAAFIFILSFLIRIKSADKSFAFFQHIPLSVIIICSFIFGYIWRGIVPVAEGTVSPYPEMVAALQSATIFAAVIFWMRPFSKENLHALAFLGWLTAASSINIFLFPDEQFVFSVFCLTGLAVVILHTMKKPETRKYKFLYYRDFILYSFLIVLTTIGLYLVISKTIVLLDDAYMNLMRNYVLPKSYSHFLKIDSRLSLISPGRSAWDKNPVLEISIPEVGGVYLKTQVFEDFNDGTWLEKENPFKKVLSNTMDEKSIPSSMIMFSSLKNIIPSPAGVTAIKGNTIYTKSDNGIIYTEDDQRTRIIDFTLTAENQPVNLTKEEINAQTSLPAQIIEDLKAISAGIVKDEENVLRKTELIQEFFHKNFKYSLNVNFRADNKGIIDFLINRRPAYCTYFATALALLLRAEDIPARVATGFLTYEKNDAKQNKFLARVQHAHAWTEVLIPRINEKTNRMEFRWEIFDATPSGQRADAISKKSFLQLDTLFEKIWLNILRLRAYIENTDKDKLKIRLLAALILFMIFSNRKSLYLSLQHLIRKMTGQIMVKIRNKNLLQLVYERYENYLMKTFQESRKTAETDAEVIARLKRRKDIPSETLSKVQSFIKDYHAVRFGNKKNIELEEIILTFEKTSKK